MGSVVSTLALIGRDLLRGSTFQDLVVVVLEIKENQSGRNLSL